MFNAKFNIPYRPFFHPAYADEQFKREMEIKMSEAILSEKLVDFAKRIAPELDIEYLEVLEALGTIGGESEETMEKILLIVSVKKLPVEYAYQMVKRGGLA